MTDSPASRATTQFVDGPNARFAYRRFGGRSGVPLVMALRFRGTMDHWDPALLDRLAAERDVIVFDNVGHGRTSGIAPSTIDGLAAGLIEFVDALGLAAVDLLGWSLGGIVAQAVTLRTPTLVRRLIIAASSPGGGIPAMPQPDPKIWQVATKPVSEDDDFLYLFFPDTATGRQLGLASLRRIDAQLDELHTPVSPEAIQAQLAAISSLGTSIWQRLDEITVPVLIANGTQDVMIDSYASYAIARRLPNAKLVLWGDAGHGFLFQHHAEFGDEILAFLRDR